MINPWHLARAHPTLSIQFVDMPDGILGRCDMDTDTIYLCNRMRQRQRRAVLLHELNHWLRGGVEDADHLECAEERHVERMTAEALMPLEDMVEALLWARDEYELADHFHVDVATVRDRLSHLTDSERQYVDAEIDRREARIP